ncbi:MAG TPA: HEAT repeat domain-containing protein [Allosphingosinicella sp.]
MKSGEILATWLGDGARQRRTHGVAMDFVGRWARRPLFEDLDRELDGGGGASVERVLAAAGRFMDRRAELDLLIAELIAAAKSDAFFAPPLQMLTSEISSGFAIYTHPALTLTLSVMSVDGLAAKRVAAAAPSSLTFGGRPMLYEFVRSGGATISLWEIPPIAAQFVADDSGRCVLRERRSIADGERILIDGRRESFVIEHASSDLVFLTAAAQLEAAPVTVEYDSRTLLFAGASSNDEAASRIQMMVTMLRLMEREDAVPLFEQLLDSPAFFTRWHVMREYLALDAEAALPGLRRMAERDPHPEVRAAAAQTLAAFFDEEPPVNDTEEDRLCRA